MNKKSPKHLEELDYLNAIACLLVILIHVLSLGVSKTAPDTLQAFIIYLPWRLSAFVVPAFLFSGAVKLGIQSESDTAKTTYIRYIAGRFKKIYIPYLVWVIIYYVVFMSINYVRGTLQEFFTYILVGNLSSQFYYIIIVMQFYLLRPLWTRLIRSVPWYIAVGCAVPITFIMLKLSAVLELIGIRFPYMDRVFPTYLIFWVFGLYVGKYYNAIYNSLSRIKWMHILSVVMIAAYALISYLQYAKQIRIYDMDYIKLFTDCLSIFTLLALCIAIKNSSLKLKGLLSRIHKASFSVYLSHCLFLTVGTAYMQQFGITKISVLLLLRFAICYTIPFFLFFIQDKVMRYIKKLRG